MQVGQDDADVFIDVGECLIGVFSAVDGEAFALEPREERLRVLEMILRVVVPAEVDVDVELAVGGQAREVEEGEAPREGASGVIPTA